MKQPITHTGDAKQMDAIEEMGHVGSWFWDLQNDTRNWSNEFYRIYGLPPGDKRLNAETALNFIHPNDREAAMEAIQFAIKNKLPYNYEKRLVRQDGSLRYIAGNGKATYNNIGEPLTMFGTIHDITDLKKTESLLIKEKEKLSQYLDAAASVFLIINKDHTVELINRKGCEILGYSSKEIIGKNWFRNFIPKRDRKELKKLFDQIIDGKIDPPEVYENWVVTKESKEKLIRWRNAFLKDGKGNVSGLISSGVDITESKNYQNLLRTRTKALEAAGNGIIIADAQEPDLPIIYSNTAFTQMTGYTQNEVLGKNCRFLQNDDRDQEEIKTLAIALQKGESCHVVLRNYKKDGTLFWNELTITPLYDKNKKLTHFIGVQNDVSEMLKNREQLEKYTGILEEKVAERTKEVGATVQKLIEANINLEDQIQTTKAAENRAMASQALFAAIAKNFPKGVIIVFNIDLEFVYLEGEELKKFDFDKNDFEGKCIDDVPIISKKLKEKIKEDIKKTLSGKHLSFELTYGRESYSANSIPLYADNNITWALFVYSNITQQKQVQQELKNALKIEQELNELKSRFISMASHEFRTPLSAILSSATLIGKQNEAGKEERREKHVARIKANVKNLVVILNDFLSLSKLEEGKVTAKPEHFDLIPFVKNLLEELEGNKKEGQAIQLIKTAKAIPVHLDPKLLNHILINLLSNAIKYSHENTEIKFTIKTGDDKVRLSIKDQGIGIPVEEQEQLFERFFRAENSTNIQGTGLGLHIVKLYAELMRGSVNFKSEVGKGSTFNVELPLNLEK